MDISYKRNTAFCSAVVYDLKQKKVLEIVNSKIPSKEPYLPGLFMLKESKPIFHILKKLKQKFDVLLVDGNGQLHPRFCGLACYVGVKLDVPTIGVAKKLLCGKIQNNSVIYRERTVGSVINKNKKNIYISVGHKIALKTATRLVSDAILNDNWYPEPLRLADLSSKELRRS